VPAVRFAARRNSDILEPFTRKRVEDPGIAACAVMSLQAMQKR
jgi:hypothetical protein